MGEVASRFTAIATADPLAGTSVKVETSEAGIAV